ncbi:hypothetical protein QQF54_06845 [Lelliottia sp. V106_10]|uniref:hypothetical protein n=1 Tax=Lelliottia wanjuensis TaxID=3050585 RepID=UPI00254C21F6|nr:MULTISPECIES: hypothetical protein [unclassified Lelliottia]MDK9357434.1 hypothetical protein [Lelliottia sp. V106_16]MDK9373074.1 hypothetical protein [Lelliottia sp. V106_10]MDK9599878.1 hypothetical protein [Lelliottia sp. V106_5]
MNTALPRYLSIISILLFLSACSAVRDTSDRAYVYDQEHSIAWNIINSSGMDTYRDAQVTPSQKLMYSRTDYDFSFPELRGDNLNESSLSLTPLLQYIPTGMGAEDWQNDGFLAWIPTELASSPEVASQILSDTFEHAVLETLKESKKVHGDFRKGEGYNDYLGKYVFQVNASRYLAIQFADEYAGCELHNNKYFDAAIAKLPDCTLYINFHDSEKIVRTPDFISKNITGKSYLIRHDGVNASFISPIYRQITNRAKTNAVRLNYAFAQQLSRHLPDWVIIYISPHEESGMPAVALQAGKVHFFIRSE